MRKGVIFLIPVPIGNLGDITLRALETLKSVSLIACEDTRKTAFLLSRYEISHPRLLSFHKFNERSRELALFKHLEQGEDLAIVSDAGSPAISDPAALFVKAAISRDFEVQALPGATALIPALSVSGFDTSAFQFLGFLPDKTKYRKALLEQIANATITTIIYESVHNLKQSLQEMKDYFPKRRIAIVREISKLHEQCIRGSVESIVEDFSITLKGEFVIVIEGAEDTAEPFPNAEAEQMVTNNPQLKSRELAKQLADRFKISKNIAYEYVLKSRP